MSCYTNGINCSNGKTWRSSQAVFVDAAGPNSNADEEMEAYFQLNSIINGRPDGVALYWVDGMLVIGRHDLMRRTGVHPNMLFSQLRMAPYISNGSPVRPRHSGSHA